MLGCGASPDPSESFVMGDMPPPSKLPRQSQERESFLCEAGGSEWGWGVGRNTEPVFTSCSWGSPSGLWTAALKVSFRFSIWSMAAWQAWCGVGMGGAGQKEVVEGEAGGACSSVNPSTHSTSTAKSL